MMVNQASKKALILIASNRQDALNTAPVVACLQQYNHPVFIYETDQVMQGNVPFSIKITSTSGLIFAYDDQRIDLSRIGAAWYRRPEAEMPHADKGVEMQLNQERAAIQSVLWRNVPEHAWLNPPAEIYSSQRKLPQLQLAVQLGLTIPATISSNSWQEVIETLPGDVIIYKMAERGRLQLNGEDRFVYTQLFAKTDTAPASRLTMPGIWQAYIPKKREWRVTFVGEQVFAATIYTSERAKDDWRRRQFNDADVTFKKGKFPPALAIKCQQMLRQYGLRFGAFDFIETPAGEFIFLELNPNGQYMWLQNKLDMPIAEAIANTLMAIAKDSHTQQSPAST